MGLAARKRGLFELIIVSGGHRAVPPVFLDQRSFLSEGFIANLPVGKFDPILVRETGFHSLSVCYIGL
jgi:hypothetical protein